MPRPTEAVIVRHPESGSMLALDPAMDYAPDDVLVRAYPWAFVVREFAAGVVESVSVEAATANPGEKRSRSK